MTSKPVLRAADAYTKEFASWRFVPRIDTPEHRDTTKGWAIREPQFEHTLQPQAISAEQERIFLEGGVKEFDDLRHLRAIQTALRAA